MQLRMEKHSPPTSGAGIQYRLSSLTLSVMIPPIQNRKAPKATAWYIFNSIVSIISPPFHCIKRKRQTVPHTSARTIHLVKEVITAVSKSINSRHKVTPFLHNQRVQSFYYGYFDRYEIVKMRKYTISPAVCKHSG